MTPLIRKSHPIDYTRAGARARSRLRSPASGLAVTGRLAAACLLFAGILDAGSAMAQQKQPVILHMGGGSATFSLADEGLGSGTLHHYQLDGTDERVEPANKTFLVGTSPLSLITISNGEMTIAPVSSGKFRMAFDTDTGDDKDFDTLFEVEVMSYLAPYIKGTDDGDDATEYNEEVTAPYAVTVDLLLENMESVEWKDDAGLDSRFGDENDVFLTYTAMADSVDHDDSPDTDKEAIVTATVVYRDKLTFALTDKAETAVRNNMGNTRVWVFAHDGSGEYARLQVDVTVQEAQNMYVMHPQEDLVYREDDVAGAIPMLDLGARFTNPIGGGTDDVFFSVGFGEDQGTAMPDKEAAAYTLTAPSMVVAITQGNDGATLDITDLRAPGSVDFTVKATDYYKCPDGYEASGTITRDTSCSKTGDTTAALMEALPDYEKGAAYSFTITVVTRTTPKPTEHVIEDVSLIGDGEAKMVDLADLDSKQDDEQPAFSDPAQGGLTYTVELDKPVATASVDSSVITLTPVWHADPDPRSATVTVTAKNNMEETFQRTFMVTVTHAVAPIVNEALEAVLAAGYTLWMTVCDSTLTLDLTDLMLPGPFYPDKPSGPAFINPYPDHGSLPGGLLYEMTIEADFKRPGSTENHVMTSAMSIGLYPAKATLTITPYSYGTALITILASNRAGKSAVVALPVTVTSCPVSTEDSELPKEVELSQNYPNPFNPQTTIDYALPQTGDVHLIVYDMLGREMDVLIDGFQAIGRYTVHFNAEHLPNGAYVYRLVAGKKIITRTMVLVK